MHYAWLVAGAVLCAIQALRATRLLSSALWLAGVSALVAIAMYEMGAKQVAVVELSVGAGLVTVLFVFAISIAGDDAMADQSVVPWSLAVGLLALFVIILGAMVLPLDEVDSSIQEPSFATMLWDHRALDVLVQIVLIFTGVLAVLGLLSDIKTPIGQQAAPRSLVEPVAGGNGKGTPDTLAQTVTEAAAEPVTAAGGAEPEVRV
jgi:uncharacterized MnhB-related membrane protein